jgi:hypothetical protein
MRIYKHKLRISIDEQEIVGYKGMMFLSLQNQNNDPAAWFMVDENADRLPFKFRFFETGAECPEIGYLGTVQFGNEAYVLHLFSMGPRRVRRLVL